MNLYLMCHLEIYLELDLPHQSKDKSMWDFVFHSSNLEHRIPDMLNLEYYFVSRTVHYLTCKSSKGMLELKSSKLETKGVLSHGVWYPWMTMSNTCKWITQNYFAFIDTLCHSVIQNYCVLNYLPQIRPRVSSYCPWNKNLEEFPEVIACTIRLMSTLEICKAVSPFQ